MRELFIEFAKISMDFRENTNISRYLGKPIFHDFAPPFPTVLTAVLSCQKGRRGETDSASKVDVTRGSEMKKWTAAAAAALLCFSGMKERGLCYETSKVIGGDLLNHKWTS